MLCVFVVACTLARTTGERMRYAYVMRGTQKKHVLHLLPSLFFSNWSDLSMARSSSTLCRARVFFEPCINGTTRNVWFRNLRVVEWRGLCVFGPLSKIQLAPPPSPLNNGRRRHTRTINTSSVRDARKGEKVQRTTHNRRCHSHSGPTCETAHRILQCAL